MFGHLKIILIISTIIELKAQESCVLNSTHFGECLSIGKCDYAKELLKMGQRPKLCRFEGHCPIVCCPKVETVTRAIEYGKIAKEKCKEILNIYEDKEVTGFSVVIGGVNAQSEDYLHMAALGYGDREDVQWLCGGSLISDKFILTAAHCLISDYGPISWVRLGEFDLNSTTDEAEPLDLRVKLTFKHPNYKPPSKYNDIALLELEKPVKFTKYIKPACLETEEEIDSLRWLFATGWGIVDVENNRISRLQEVRLSMYTHEECRSAYNTTNVRRLKNGIINSQMCAGGRNDLKDTCRGDSGGPLQYRNKKVGEDYYRGFKIIGITSFGKVCGLTSSPGVYTKVSKFIPWIESIVWPNN